MLRLFVVIKSFPRDREASVEGTGLTAEAARQDFHRRHLEIYTRPSDSSEDKESYVQEANTIVEVLADTGAFEGPEGVYFLVENTVEIN